MGRSCEEDEWLKICLLYSCFRLSTGFLKAATSCLQQYNNYEMDIAREHSVEGGSSKVDYVVVADGEDRVLVEAKSPAVMKKLDEDLPAHGIKLKWLHNQSIAPKILQKVSRQILNYNTNLKRLNRLPCI